MYSFVSHIQVVHEGLRVKRCPVERCDYTTSRTNMISLHLRKWHPEEAGTAFSCSICGFRAEKEVLIAQHMKMTHL